jgi:hypothetical protein
MGPEEQSFGALALKGFKPQVTTDEFSAVCQGGTLTLTNN